MSKQLHQIFKELGITQRGKLGDPNDNTSQTSHVQDRFETRRTEVQDLLKTAAKLRSKAITKLNIAFYIIIGIIVLSIGVQLLIKKADILIYIQSACVVGLFPLSQRIERSVTKQAYLEFVAAFLPDLDPKDAIKAIQQLYHSLNNPKSIKDSIDDAD